jgi:hypothetical protein
LIQGGKWNFISLPIDPINPDPVVVLDEINVPNASLQYWNRNAQSGGWIGYGNEWVGPMVRGQSYWFIEPYASMSKQICYRGYEPGAKFTISLPAKSTAPYWIQFGTPFLSDVPCESIKFTCSSLGNKLMSWAEAFAGGLVESKAIGFDSMYQQFYTAGIETTLPELTSLKPWTGYWLLIDRSNSITLEFTKPGAL